MGGHGQVRLLLVNSCRCTIPGPTTLRPFNAEMVGSCSHGCSGKPNMAGKTDDEIPGQMGRILHHVNVCFFPGTIDHASPTLNIRCFVGSSYVWLQDSSPHKFNDSILKKMMLGRLPPSVWKGKFSVCELLNFQGVSKDIGVLLFLLD